MRHLLRIVFSASLPTGVRTSGSKPHGFDYQRIAEFPWQKQIHQEWPLRMTMRMTSHRRNTHSVVDLPYSMTNRVVSPACDTSCKVVQTAHQHTLRWLLVIHVQSDCAHVYFYSAVDLSHLLSFYC
jgi:hypothetical protein